MSSKLLKIVFVILLVVTVGELGYYFYVLKVNPLSGTNSVRLNANPSLQTDDIQSILTPTPRPIPTGYKKAIHPDFRAHLDRYITFKENTKDERLLLISETKGEVVEIDRDGSKGPNRSFFPFGLKIKNRDAPDGGWGHFSRGLLEKTIVYIVQPEKEIIGSLEDIKVGSKIVKRDTSDLAFSPSDPAHIVENVIKIY